MTPRPCGQEFRPRCVQRVDLRRSRRSQVKGAWRKATQRLPPGLVERDKCLAASTLERLLAIAGVGEEVLQRGRAGRPGIFPSRDWCACKCGARSDGRKTPASGPGRRGAHSLVRAHRYRAAASRFGKVAPGRPANVPCPLRFPPRRGSRSIGWRGTGPRDRAPSPEVLARKSFSRCAGNAKSVGLPAAGKTGAANFSFDSLQRGPRNSFVKRERSSRPPFPQLQSKYENQSHPPARQNDACDRCEGDGKCARALDVPLQQDGLRP